MDWEPLLTQNLEVDRLWPCGLYYLSSNLIGNLIGSTYQPSM